MKIIIKLCLTCLITIWFLNNAQAQIDMNIQPVGGNCFYVVATTPDVMESIKVYCDEFLGGASIEVRNTNICEGTICVNPSTSAPVYSIPIIHCEAKGDNVRLYDGCIIVIDPSPRP